MKAIMKFSAPIFIFCFIAFFNSLIAQENSQPSNTSQSYVKIKTMKIVNGDTIVTEKEYRGNGDMQIEDTLNGNGFGNFSFHSFKSPMDSSFYGNFDRMQDMFRDFNFGGDNLFFRNFDFPEFRMPHFGFDVDSIIKEFNFRDNDSLFPSLRDNQLIIKSFRDKSGEMNNDSMKPNMDMQIYGKNDKGQQVTYNKKITILDKGISSDKKSKEELPIEVFPNPGDGYFNISFGLDPKNETDIVITDMNGNEMLKETMEKSSGMYTRQFDMKNYAKGEYLINIKQSRKSASRHIIID